MLLHGTNESIDRTKIRQYNDIGYGSTMGKYTVLKIYVIISQAWNMRLKKLLLFYKERNYI